VPKLEIGNSVRWVRAVASPEYRNAIGTVTAIIPNDNGLDDFTMYDIHFPFGLHTLYGTQIEPE